MANRYSIQKTKDGTGWCCTDTENLIVVIFKHKEFNKTQKLEVLEDFDPANFMTLSRLGRELGEWLVNNHPDKI